MRGRGPSRILQRVEERGSPASIEPEAGLMVTTNIRLVRPLGEGGMGAVWVADHLALHTQVVVKFMSSDLAESTEALARFSREAAAAAQVKSPHVVQTLDHGVMPGGKPYIVMELLEGHDLASHLAARGKLAPRETLAIITQLSRALSKAHAGGIVHRDIKPNNVFLCDAGSGELFVKLLDFGIAKARGVEILESSTRTGSFVGSPFYMSPEQVVGAKKIDFKSDLWSLGVVAFEALTGKKPFYADNVGALALKIHRDPIPTPTSLEPSLPAAIDAWFTRACAREPADRFASAKAMADALAVALTGEGLGAAMGSEPEPRAPVVSAFASTTPAETSTMRSGSSEAVSADGAKQLVPTGTDAGVGLSSRVLPRSTMPKKVLIAVVIAGAAIGLGFAVPKMVGGTATSEKAEGSRAAAMPSPSANPRPKPNPSADPSPSAGGSGSGSGSVGVSAGASGSGSGSGSGGAGGGGNGAGAAVVRVAPRPVVSAKPKVTATVPDDDGIK